MRPAFAPFIELVEKAARGVARHLPSGHPKEVDRHRQPTEAREDEEDDNTGAHCNIMRFSRRMLSIDGGEFGLDIRENSTNDVGSYCRVSGASSSFDAKGARFCQNEAHADLYASPGGGCGRAATRTHRYSSRESW